MTALDDGKMREEVDLNMISQSAGILKAETMQEPNYEKEQPAGTNPEAEGKNDDWDDL